MADIAQWAFRGVRQRRSPKIDEVMRAVETTCRQYDRGISTCVWLLMVLLVWFVVAGTAGVDEIKYSGELVNGTSSAFVAQSRHDSRVLHRVFKAMHDSCARDKSPIIVGPQIVVNGRPFMKRVLTICHQHGTHIDMVNPVIAVTGGNYGTCIDEIDGHEKHRQRPYPITLHSDNSAPHTVLELVDVFTVLQSLDVLNGIW